MRYFGLFSKTFQKRVKFSRVFTKNIIFWEFLRKFSKFIEQIEKRTIFAYSQQNSKNYRYFLGRLDEMLGNFEIF